MSEDNKGKVLSISRKSGSTDRWICVIEMDTAQLADFANAMKDAYAGKKHEPDRERVPHRRKKYRELLQDIEHEIRKSLG